MRDAPAWTTHTHQVRPGETILVNRDEEDGEAGDVGLRRTRAGDGGILNEKQSQGDSGSSGSGSGTGSGSGSGSDAYNQRHVEKDINGHVIDEKQGEERSSGEGEGARRRNVYAYDRERGDPAEMEQDRHDAHGERAGRDTAREGGRRTPPVAEYREGDDLIVERQNRETDEVRISPAAAYKGA